MRELAHLNCILGVDGRRCQQKDGQTRLMQSKQVSAMNGRANATKRLICCEKKVSRNLESWLGFSSFYFSRSETLHTASECAAPHADIETTFWSQVNFLLLLPLALSPTRDRTIFYLNFFAITPFFAVFVCRCYRARVSQPVSVWCWLEWVHCVLCGNGLPAWSRFFPRLFLS